MKRKIVKTKDNAPKRVRKAIIAFLILGAFLTNLTGAPLTSPRYGSTGLTSIPQPPRQDDPLDSEAAAAFVAALGDEARNVLNDFLDMDGVTTTFDQINTKVTERGDLAGKTKKQIVDLYLADVRSVVEDADTIKGMETAFARLLNPDAQPETPPADPPTDPPANPPANPPTNPSSSAGLRQYIKGLKYDARVLLAVQGDGGTLILDKEKDKKNGGKAGCQPQNIYKHKPLIPS